MHNAEFPEKLACLFQPKRLKVLYGGRGAGRSWGVARALLLQGTQKPLRVLCAREFQNSIADSVHKLLSDQISALGLDDFYEIQQNRIFERRNPISGTSFSFEGIKNNTSRIKSYEGIDICWVEEAVKVSRASWGILIPTIRKSGSEIWLTYNPELETDYTHQRFVKSAIADPLAVSHPSGALETEPGGFSGSIVVKMTYRDNPFFPKVLLDELESDKKRDYDYYLNVWEGHCLQMLEGVVYAKELRRATEENRIISVPYAPEVPVDTFWDLGRADNTAIWFAQRVSMQYRVLAYYEANGLKVNMEDDSGGFNHFLRELQRRPYVYGDHWLPHDAKAKRLGTKRSIEEMLKAKFPGRVHIVPHLSRLDGINAGRIFFQQAWFDEEKCADGLNALRHYRYKVVDGQPSNEPLHDWASDGADAFRYMALAMTGKRKGSNVAEKLEEAKLAGMAKGREVGAAMLGWMR